MATWMTAKELGDALGLGLTRSKDIIKSRHYKKHPLTVRYEKSKKGKPTALVLWDTETNQPATPGDTDHAHSNPSPTSAPVFNQGDRLIPSVAGSLNSGAKSQPTQLKPSPELDDAGAKAATGDHDGLPIAAQPQKPDDYQKAQATALPKIVYMAIEDQSTAPIDDLSPQEAAVGVESDEPPDFETLLHQKVCDKKKSTQRSLKAYYRKLYKESGEIPPALFVDEGRCFAGKKSTLDSAIHSRFIDMVIKSSDATDIFSYYTKDQRKVTVFHENLEKEFGRKIAINQLYTVVRSCNLKRYLEMSDDEDGVQKMPGFFKAEPVGALVQMDGVEADYFEIYEDGRWRKPIWIEFFDLGSRKLLAMHAYLSESSKNAVDIFTRFLIGNEFAHQQMNIRPDNAGGFKNLKRPIHELNRRYSVPGGFIFIDDFARAGTPKDKAHLESSHRAAHKNLERSIINHFKDRIDSQYKKQKKIGNTLRAVTVTRLKITLEELNSSGMTENYMKRHNGEKHRFTEDGMQRSWVPDDRWNAHLNANKTFRFKADDIELCKRYGYEKAVATISKEGTITYLKRKYYVENKELWSRSSSTKVKISLIDDHLAIFKPHDDGEYIGAAKALQAPVKPDSIINREKAKVIKIQTENEQFSIIEELKAAGMIVGEKKVRQMIDEGLTLELTRQLLLEHHDKYSKRPGTLLPFNQFTSDVTRLLAELNPKKLIPYAGVRA